MVDVDKDVLSALIDDAILDVDFYGSQVPELKGASPLEMAAHYLTIGEGLGLSPSGMFDPKFYLMMNSDLRSVSSPVAHFAKYGRLEGRISSPAAELVASELDSVAIDAGLIPSPSVDSTDPGYLNACARALLACEHDLRYFSKYFYLSRYPDIAGQPIDPLLHYLRYGRNEGRVTNVSLLANIQTDDNLVRPDKPYVVVGVHEASKTGAPIVGLDMARELARSYNVIFVTMRDGPLIETAKTLFPVIVISTTAKKDNSFFAEYIKSKFNPKDVILSSSVCYPMVHGFSSKGFRITCLVHEFYEYMLVAQTIIYLCDLLVFSSRELLKSWQYMLDNYTRDPATILVLPQPASAASERALSKAAARAAVAAATGLDLDEATLILGAGQIQIRKGTDIFLQIGSQLKRDADKFVTVWIGEQVSEFEPTFGIWLHAQIERSRDENGESAVHFEPAGPLYTVLMDAADVFLMTSRLDPLPNVALDAAGRNIPVIAFRGATGLADIADNGQMELVEVEIGAVDQMISAIKSLANIA